MDTDLQCSSDNAPEQIGHLWTPWRMSYVGGDRKEAECIFCNRLASNDDVGHLIVARDELAFAMLNLFPYNTGHLMVVPNAHVPSPEELDDRSTLAMAMLAKRVLAALRSALSCEGFNLGLNVGSVAGAGVAEHMHQHIVPRWTGDANFMPLLAGTMVMPELLPATYAKVRAELEAPASFRLVAMSRDGKRVAVFERQEGPTLPQIDSEPGVPVWKSAVRLLSSLGLHVELAGWAGAGSSAAGGDTGLAYVAGDAEAGQGGLRFLPVDECLRNLNDSPVSAMIDLTLRRFLQT